MVSTLSCSVELHHHCKGVKEVGRGGGGSEVHTFPSAKLCSVKKSVMWAAVRIGCGKIVYTTPSLTVYKSPVFASQDGYHVSAAVSKYWPYRPVKATPVRLVL